MDIACSAHEGSIGYEWIVLNDTSSNGEAARVEQRLSHALRLCPDLPVDPRQLGRVM